MCVNDYYTSPQNTVALYILWEFVYVSIVWASGINLHIQFGPALDHSIGLKLVVDSWTKWGILALLIMVNSLIRHCTTTKMNRFKAATQEQSPGLSTMYNLFHLGEMLQMIWFMYIFMNQCDLFLFVIITQVLIILHSFRIQSLSIQNYRRQRHQILTESEIDEDLYDDDDEELQCQVCHLICNDLNTNQRCPSCQAQESEMFDAGFIAASELRQPHI